MCPSHTAACPAVLTHKLGRTIAARIALSTDAQPETNHWCRLIHAMSTSAFFSGRRLGRAGAGSAVRPVAASRSHTCVVRAERVLIVNTKKGGHAFLGLYLAKRLLGKGYGVTIFNDGDPVRPCPPGRFPEACAGMHAIAEGAEIGCRGTPTPRPLARCRQSV